MLVSVSALGEIHYKLKLCVNVTWWNDMLVTVPAMVGITMVVILLSLRSFLFLCLITFLNLYHCTVSCMQFQMLKKADSTFRPLNSLERSRCINILVSNRKGTSVIKYIHIISSSQCRKGRFEYAVIDTKYKQGRKKRLHFLSTT